MATEVTEDVIASADFFAALHSGEPAAYTVWDVIVLAITAERERCALICDNKMYDFGCIAGDESQDFVAVCAELSAEIRSPTTQIDGPFPSHGNQSNPVVSQNTDGGNDRTSTSGGGV